VVNRVNNGTDLNVTWNHVTPNLTAQEAYVHSYQIRYYRYQDVGNSNTVSLGNVTYHLIEGIDVNTQYTVEVRAAVLESVDPNLTLQYGEWSGTLLSEPIGKL